MGFIAKCVILNTCHALHSRKECNADAGRIRPQSCAELSESLTIAAIGIPDSALPAEIGMTARIRAVQIPLLMTPGASFAPPRVGSDVTSWSDVCGQIC